MPWCKNFDENKNDGRENEGSLPGQRSLKRMLRQESAGVHARASAGNGLNETTIIDVTRYSPGLWVVELTFSSSFLRLLVPLLLLT